MGNRRLTFTMKLLASLAISGVYSAIPERADELTLNDLVQQLDSIPKSWEHGLSGKFSGNKKPSEYSYLMGSLPIPAELDLVENPVCLQNQSIRSRSPNRTHDQRSNR